MKYILAVDIGTTAAKGVMVDENYRPSAFSSADLVTLFDGDRKEQKPDDWYEAFRTITKDFLAQGYAAEDILAVAMSSQMQDLIFTGADGKAAGNAILYSDARAAEEAEEIRALLGDDRIRGITGNDLNGSIPFAKLLWAGRKLPAAGRGTAVLFGAKDYVILQLTGRQTADVVCAATTGLMDIHRKQWHTAFLNETGLSGVQLPDLLYADEAAGTVTARAERETGLRAGTPVFAGTGDAGATSLASGIVDPGEYNVNLGTSGWVATVSGDVSYGAGLFNLAAVPRDRYINVIPFFNAANVHNWVSRMLAKDSEQNTRYEYTDGVLRESVPGSHGVLFLPYLTGERFPVVDTEIKGGFAGITPATTKQDMARAALEGVAFSIRQGLEDMKEPVRSLSLIGGGAENAVWCQIFADVLNREVTVFRNAAYLPSVAVAAVAMRGLGRLDSYLSFRERMQKESACITFRPDEHAVRVLAEGYARYRRLYPALKELE